MAVNIFSLLRRRRLLQIAQDGLLLQDLLGSDLTIAERHGFRMRIQGHRIIKDYLTILLCVLLVFTLDLVLLLIWIELI